MSQLSILCAAVMWLCYTGVVSQCPNDCPDPPDDISPYGTRTWFAAPNGKHCRAEYECMAGYTRHGARVLNCRNAKKGWRGNPFTYKPTCEPTCGDAMLVTGEDCDVTAGDNDCYPPGHPLECTSWACGDWFITGLEECDDGNTIYGDGCQGDCMDPVCGDNTLDAGEECDDGNTIDADGCQGNCKLPVCGDGILDAGEECDDGNVINDDGCHVDCMLPVCGDGILDLTEGEQCDDGNDGAVGGFNDDCCDGATCLTIAPGTGLCPPTI